ncbi:LysR family transcriptional regulator [Shewanella sp. YLB-07]|uniref:LysR family transcriptional regulator n=1 Tax=Shewanella sp. YLB-07 TaxID=2601268 RepID=UPI00128D2C25|nr:LysR family transcriptional regulator [Shewanella sp. YLB-07]MPY26406.1 LysR family transcriptional regulator [Shewanella sp. YLB-07]
MSSPELLRSFIAAADTGSFSAAARLLGKHQATISGNVARLEDELAVILFDRVGKYPEITPQGLALYDSAKLVVESTARFNRNALNLAAGLPVLITLGLDEDLPTAPLVGLFKKIRQQYPLLKINILREPSQQLFKLIEGEQLDLALSLTLEGQTNIYEYKAIGSANYHLVCGKRHPFARKATISTDEMMHSTQILQRSLAQNNLHQTVKIAFDTWECQGFEAQLEAIRANVGWAFLANYPYQPMPEGITQFNAEFAAVDFSSQYDLIWPKGRAITEVEKFICDQIMSLFSQK